VDAVIDQLDDANRRNVEGQLGFFDSPDADGFSEPASAQVPELPYAELLAMEKETTGLYLSGHPLAPYAAFYQTGAWRVSTGFLAPPRRKTVITPTVRW